MARGGKRRFKDMPVSVELSNDSIKLAGVSYSKEGAVFRLVKKKFFSKEPDDLFREIAHLFKAHKFSTKNVSLNIPRHLAMERVLHLPSTKDEEINNMVKMESARQMPYRDENIIAGFRVIEKMKDGYSNVLLSVAEEGTVMRFINTLRGAGLSIGKVVLGSESLFCWYSTVTEKSKEDKNITAALINMDSEYIDIDIIRKEKLEFSRSFSYSGGEPAIGGDTVEEIKKSITTYQKERKANVEKVLISGAGRAMRAVEPVLKDGLGIPVTLLEQTKGIEIDGETEVDFAETSFIELIGLSLKGREMKINLLPEGMVEDRELRFLKRNISRMLVLFLCIILVLSGIVIKKIFDKSQYLGLLNSKIKSMEPKVIKAKRMRDDIKIIKDVIEKKPLAIDIVSEIYKMTPAGITFNLLDYQSNVSLVLRGNAPSLDSIIRFINILENSAYFEDVKVKYTSKRPVVGRQVTDFEIVCMLSRVE